MDRHIIAAVSVDLLLTDLPDDVIYVLLSFCDLQIVGRLARVSQRLYQLVRQDVVWIHISKRLSLVRSYTHTNSFQGGIREECRVARNWKRGICRDIRLVHHNCRQLPWLQLYDDHIWISNKRVIRCYRLRGNGFLKEVTLKSLEGHQEDVCRFVCKDGTIVSGARDGSLAAFNSATGERLKYLSRCHASDLQAVDFHSDTVVSGSRDATVKVWRLSTSNALQHTLPVQDRVWSIAVNPDGNSFIVGTAGIRNPSPLRVVDLNRVELQGSLGNGYKRGAGIQDIQYTSSNTLLSCGYDTFIRLWDLRQPYSTCATCWEEPNDSTLYCIKSDNENAFVVGTAHHGVARLWDKRWKTPVQMYYIGRATSPVYSVAFNSSHLYAALDKGINLLDFSVALPT